jgi:preprotein translocase subunit SecG
MSTVLLIVHLCVTLALIGVVLIQRSEGGGLGVGTSQGMGSFMSGRGTANLLTRATAILAGIFMVLSLLLALLYRGGTGSGHSLLDAAAPGGGGAAPPAGQTAPATPAAGDQAPAAAPSGTAPSGTAPSGAAPSGTAPAGAAPAGKGPAIPTN